MFADCVNMPPAIQRGNESEVYWAVYKLVGGKTDTLIMTLCRTGFRSVLVANILADPQNTANEEGRPSTSDATPFTKVTWACTISVFEHDPVRM